MTLVARNFRPVIAYGGLNRREVNSLGAGYVSEYCGVTAGSREGKNPVILRFGTSQLDTKVDIPMFL